MRVGITLVDRTNRKQTVFKLHPRSGGQAIWNSLLKSCKKAVKFKPKRVFLFRLAAPVKKTKRPALNGGPGSVPSTAEKRIARTFALELAAIRHVFAVFLGRGLKANADLIDLIASFSQPSYEFEDVKLPLSVSRDRRSVSCDVSDTAHHSACLFDRVHSGRHHFKFKLDSLASQSVFSTMHVRFSIGVFGPNYRGGSIGFAKGSIGFCGQWFWLAGKQTKANLSYFTAAAKRNKRLGPGDICTLCVEVTNGKIQKLEVFVKSGEGLFKYVPNAKLTRCVAPLGVGVTIRAGDKITCLKE